MIEAFAKAFAEAVRPAREAAETTQGLAKLLRRAAEPLVSEAKPRTDDEFDALDELVVTQLTAANIRPDSNLGLFARRRVSEMARLPFQMSASTGDFSPGAFPGVTGWWEAPDLSGQSDGSDVTSWVNRIGGPNWGQHSSGNYPDKETSAYQYVDFLESNTEALDMAGTVASMIGNTGFLAAVVYLDGDPSITTSPGFYDSNGIVIDAGGYYGLSASTNAGTPRFLCGIYDGAAKTILLPTTADEIHIVMMWRTAGGNIEASLDGVAATPVASGAPQVQTGVLQLGCDYGANVFLNGRVYAMLTSTQNGGSAERAKLLAYWQAKYPNVAEPAPPEVTIADSADITTGGSYTAAAGSDRAVVACVGALGSGAPSGATFGGVAMTQAVVADGDGRRTVIYYLLEASIPVGSQTLTVTSAGITDTWIGTIYTLTGVNQSSPVADTATATDPDGTEDPQIATSSLTVGEGDMTLTVIAQRNDKTDGLVAAPSFTEDRMTYSGVTTRGVAHRAEASATSYTPEWEHGLGGSVNESSCCWAVFQP